MKKFNRNYLSIYEWVRWTKPLANSPNGYSEYGLRYHDDSIIPTVQMFYDDLALSRYQLLGGLHPFYKMAKDLRDTFKPYATANKVVRDLLQPVRGAENILKGFGSLAGGALLMTAWTVVAPFALIGCLLPSPLSIPCISFFRSTLSHPVSWMIEGAANIMRGAAQVITTPVTLLARVPLRGILTGIAKLAGKTFFAEKKPSIQRLAVEAYSKLDQVNQCAVLNDSEEPTIVAVLNEIEKKCQLDKEQHQVKEWMTHFFGQAKSQLEKSDQTTIQSLRAVRSTIKRIWSALEEKEQNKSQQTKKILVLLGQIQNEVSVKIAKMDPDEKIKADHQGNRVRKNVAALLFEVERKYTKSIKNGWDSACLEETSRQYNPVFNLFKEKANEDLSHIKSKEDRLISPQDIQAAKQYLENFIPTGLKSDEKEKKYYVIGDFIQTHHTSWLDGSPTALRNIQDSDIINSLKSKQAVYVFDSFAAAKRYADIHADEQNESKWATPYQYVPIVEVTLCDQNAMDKAQLEQRYIKREKDVNHLDNFLTDTVSTTSIENIKCINAYCYQYDNPRTWSSNLKGKLTPVSYIDFQEHLHLRKSYSA